MRVAFLFVGGWRKDQKGNHPTSASESRVCASRRQGRRLKAISYQYLKYLTDILEEAGYLVRPASDGELALRSIRARLPALILMDIRMPGVDGIEVCRQLKQDAATRVLPVIFISANEATELKVKALEAGGVDYVAKPFQPFEVLARIRTHLAMARDRQQLERQNLELVESRRQLAQSEAVLRVTAKIARIGGWELDVASMHLTWTEEVYRIHEADPAIPPTVQSAIDFYTPESRPVISAAVQQAMSHGTPFDVELPIRTARGNLRLVHAMGEARMNEGKVDRIFGSFQDVTEFRRTEEELQKARKLESLGVLAGGIAHDFNNLMASIFGYIEAAGDTATDPKTTLYLSKATAAIDRARGLTGQLLTFARGGAPVRTIGALFPFVQDNARFALSGANVTCQFDVQEALWPCNFDRNQIGQVIDNLVINAREAMPAGGVIKMGARNLLLEVNNSLSLTAGKYVMISIADSGGGISGEVLPRIFDPFFTTKTQGHGLGLSTCYSIVKRHGGGIHVASTPGKGSTFYVYLPAAVGLESVPVPPSGVVHRGHGTFLIMDDEEMVRETLCEMLTNFGYTAVCRENGRQAIDFMVSEIEAEHSIAGVILDLTVAGGMGGLEAIAVIRDLNRTIPVFVASGYHEDPVMKDPGAYGFTASIGKPFLKAELAGMLEKYLKPV